MMNPDNNNIHAGVGIVPSVINPSMMNGNSNNITSDKKVNNKNSKVTLDKNGKPKRKKASRGENFRNGFEHTLILVISLSELSKGPFDVR